MIRTLIALDESDKRWLDQQAALQKVSMAEVVRQAIERLRAARVEDGEDFAMLLSATSGCWRQGDGLSWQMAQREEWER